MWKAAFIGVAALALVGSTFLHAQQRPSRPLRAVHWLRSPEDAAAFREHHEFDRPPMAGRLPREPDGTAGGSSL